MQAQGATFKYSRWGGRVGHCRPLARASLLQSLSLSISLSSLYMHMHGYLCEPASGLCTHFRLARISTAWFLGGAVLSAHEEMNSMAPMPAGSCNGSELLVICVVST